MTLSSYERGCEYSEMIQLSPDGNRDYDSFRSFINGEAIVDGRKSALLRMGTYVDTAVTNIRANDVFVEGENRDNTIIKPAFAITDIAIQIAPPVVQSYGTGTVSVVDGLQTISGSGTGWTAPIVAGWVIFLNGEIYEVESVDGLTTITLTTPYRGNSASGLAYLAYDCVKRVKFKDLTFDCSDLHASGDGMFSLTQAMDVVFENCVFINSSPTGARTLFSATPSVACRVIFDRCVFDGVVYPINLGGMGLTASKALPRLWVGRNKIVDCEFRRLDGKSNVYIEGSDNLFLGNRFYNVKDNGASPACLQLVSVHNSLISDNIFSHTAEKAIVIPTGSVSTRNTIEGNHISLAIPTAGISLGNLSVANLVTGNMIYKSGSGTGVVDSGLTNLVANNLIV